MARQSRGSVPAGVYHVWRRTNGPTNMFRDDFDRTAFCKRLARSIDKYRWSCIAFVLMRTHFHLILEVEDDVLQPGMRDFFGPYAQEFNRRHGRYGHLRGEPYKLRPIWDDRGLRAAVRYVARNPVRAKVCKQPQDWHWSSYAGSAGYVKPFPFVDDRLVLETLHQDVRRARIALRDVIEVRDVKGVVPFTQA